MLRRIAPPSLLRVLVLRTATVSVLAALVIVFVAQYVSNNLVQARFQDEAAVVANTAESAIQDQIDLATHSARFVAGLPTAAEIMGAGRAGLANAPDAQAFLLFAKARLGLDALSLADLSGVVIASSQTGEIGRPLHSRLIERARANPDQSFILFDEPGGVAARGLGIIRDERTGDAIGYAEAVTILDVGFLKTVQTNSDAQLVLLWRGELKSNTVARTI